MGKQKHDAGYRKRQLAEHLTGDEPDVVLRVHDRINFIPGDQAIRIATEIADALQTAKES